VCLSTINAERLILIKNKMKDFSIVYEKRTNLMGYEYLYNEDRNGNTSHTVFDNEAPLTIHPGQDLVDFASSALKEGSSYSQSRRPLAQTNDIMRCKPDNVDYMKMMAQTAVDTPKADTVYNHKMSACFDHTEISYHWDSANQVSVLINVFNPAASMFCSDNYLLQVGNSVQFVNLFRHGKHTHTFKNLSTDDIDVVNFVGPRALILCDNIAHLIPDLFKTIGLFLGGIGITTWNIPFFGLKPYKMQKEWNVDFIKKATGYQWHKRDEKKIYIPPKESIQSGDFFAITRFDGLDQIIEYGTGSHSGHSVTAVWDHDENELYIVESQDGWYWKLGHGLQRNKYADWMVAAQAAGMNVVHMPLKKELAAKYDEKAVWKWFKTVEGTPYGYRNFLFSWIDTEFDNYPPLLDINFAYMAFTLLSHFDKKVGELLIGEALNHRLGTTGLDLGQIPAEASRQGRTMNSLFAEVEVEGTPYSDGPQYVCSCFVAAIWKRAGIFGDMEINATEFTPKDIYELQVYDTTTPLPDVCKANDPELPYCQLFGEYEMNMPNYNTVPMYSNMNERCPTKAPLYTRPDGC